MQRKYYGVRKINWDQLWHALFKRKDGSESYDRVSKDEALKIAEEL
jgi:hypothetical protein